MKMYGKSSCLFIIWKSPSALGNTFMDWLYLQISAFLSQDIARKLFSLPVKIIQKDNCYYDLWSLFTRWSNLFTD